jgi:hypothetical protein
MLMALNYSTSDIIKKEVIRGIFSSSYTGSNNTKHEEFSPTTFIEQGLDFIMSHFEEPV